MAQTVLKALRFCDEKSHLLVRIRGYLEATSTSCVLQARVLS